MLCLTLAISKVSKVHILFVMLQEMSLLFLPLTTLNLTGIHARNLCLLILLNFEENISTGNFVALSKQLNTGETSRYGSEFSAISIAVEQLM
jgi:hypothetical protein